jgi:phosphopentomutase
VTFRRIILIVLDSVGIGAMPDSLAYGDPPNSDTLGNIARARPLHLPNFCRWGLANIRSFVGLPPTDSPKASFGRCALASPGKDTTTGHWEIAGIHLEKPFPLYPNGFPEGILRQFRTVSGREVIGNKAASGTEIIRELGEEHLRTGALIVYTSADSVFQIAAHEEMVPVEQLYKFCTQARQILYGDHEVGRVIARPFTGQPGSFQRTSHRHDYAVAPPPGMLLDRLNEQQVSVLSIGKIADVYLNRGISTAWKTKSNQEGMQKTLRALEEQADGLIFTNLVDFDQNFGHRNDVEGYARALEETDAWLPALENALEAEDLAIFTADHGCDPTTVSTDHSREYTPLLAFSKSIAVGKNLGDRSSLSDIGQTIAQNFGTNIQNGQSFLAELL